jgi:hypothetical protein
MSKKIAEQFTECIEMVAREHAEEIGFDMETEPHALARMIMIVLSSKELRSKAIDLLKEKTHAR